MPGLQGASHPPADAATADEPGAGADVDSGDMEGDAAEGPARRKRPPTVPDGDAPA